MIAAHGKAINLLFVIRLTCANAACRWAILLASATCRWATRLLVRKLRVVVNMSFIYKCCMSLGNLSFWANAACRWAIRLTCASAACHWATRLFSS